MLLLVQVLALEEGAFATTLERGQKILEEQLTKAAASKDKVCAGSVSSSGADKCRHCNLSVVWLRPTTRCERLDW